MNHLRLARHKCHGGWRSEAKSRERAGEEKRERERQQSWWRFQTHFNNIGSEITSESTRDVGLSHSGKPSTRDGFAMPQGRIVFASY